MKKIFTLAAAVLASVSMWAAYAPTADEVIILKDVYDANATEAGYSNHAAIAYGGTVSFSDKKAGDPNNNGEATSSNVKTCSVKGNGGGKDITVSFEGCSQIIVYHEKQSSRYVELRADSKTGDLLGKSTGNTYFTAVDLNANNSYSIFLHGVKDDGGDQDFYIYAVKLIKGETCDDPEAHLAFTKSTAYVGDQFGYNFGSKSGGDLTTTYTLNGVTAVENTDYTFTSGNITVLKAGQFVMLMTVAARDGYCAADLSDTILINEATPVASVTIDGPATTYVGEAVTFTATAANASDYAWTVNGVDANTNAAEFTFTPAAAGEYSIVCSARNKFNAAEDWIASEAKVLTASTVSGELLKVTVTGGKTATVTGIFGGTADINVGTGEKSESDFEDQHGYKLNSNGYYVGVHSLEHALAEGDTVIVYITTASANLQLFSDKGTTKIGELIGGVQQGANKVILNSNAAGAKAIYLYRADIEGGGSSMNPYVAYISVIRPMAVKSSSEAFKSVSVNGEALVANFDANHAMTVEGSYVDAPVVVFTKTVTTIYEDNSQVVKDVEVEVTAEEVAGAWQAQATINSVTYTINAAKAASFTVHYMDGTTELGTENVAVNETVADYAKYEQKSLATFVGWYIDVDLTSEAILTAPINAETYLYAKFENKYAESINIEQLVLDNGTTYDLMSFMGGKGFASNITNSLDTLNDLEKKDNRNYAYLGLKVKAEGKLLNFRLAANSTVKVKFGNVGATPLVSINGSEYAAMELAEGVYTYTATDEALISIKTASSATLIFKQIMIDADLADVVLPAPGAYAITLTPGENGQLAASWEGKTDKKVNVPVGATVTLTVTPADGYTATSVKLNGEDIIPVENVYSFVMPEQVAEVVATFGIATALENAEAAVKAEKVIRDGQVLILRDGKIFNALGAEVK